MHTISSSLNRIKSGNMSLPQYLHMIVPYRAVDQFNNWHILLPQYLHMILSYRIFDQFSNWKILLPRYLQTFVSILVSADVTVKLSKDTYKTRVLQKNRKGVLELNWAIPEWVREKAHVGFDKYSTLLSGFSTNLLSLSKQCIRLRLINILSPDREMGNLELAEIIDIKVIQLLMNDIYRLTHIPIGLTDTKGNLLVSVGWQDICTKFHRVHPETCKHCIIDSSSGVLPGELKLYKCKNNMWDMVVPINIDYQVGYIYLGQFFFEDELLDYEFFRSQARKYGFNEQEYIAALEKVPRVSRKSMYKGIGFLLMLAKLLNHERNRLCPISWLIFRLRIYFV